LVRISQQKLDAGNKVYGIEDESLALDGKTMCNVIDEAGHQTHIMRVVGHKSPIVTQKKSWNDSNN